MTLPNGDFQKRFLSVENLRAKRAKRGTGQKNKGENRYLMLLLENGAHGANRVGHEFSLRLLLGGNKVSGTLDWRFHISRPMSRKRFVHNFPHT